MDFITIYGNQVSLAFINECESRNINPLNPPKGLKEMVKSAAKSAYKPERWLGACDADILLNMQLDIIRAFIPVFDEVDGY